MTAKKNEKALTAKQERFAELVLMGCSPSDAYRGAYDTKAKPETIAVEAWRLLHSPNIALMVEQGRARAMEGAVVTRSTLLERMEQVNKAAFEKLTAEGSERMDGAALTAFLKTYEALKANVPNDDFYSVANAELQAQSGGDWVSMALNDGHVWFRDGGKALPAPDDWDSVEVEPLPDGGTRVTKRRIR